MASAKLLAVVLANHDALFLFEMPTVLLALMLFAMLTPAISVVIPIAPAPLFAALAITASAFALRRIGKRRSRTQKERCNDES